MRFADIYIYRLGAGITLPSTCAGVVPSRQPPTVLAPAPFGQGLSFRYIQTPQVWSIGGDVSIGFDGDPSVTGAEVALSKTVGGNTVRFSILQPVSGMAGFEYVRFASVSTSADGGRQYQCVLGVSTTSADVAAAASGAFQRNVLMATAAVRNGSAVRDYSLGRSVVAVSTDQGARRVSLSLRLIGTPVDAAGPDVELGSFAASAPIDPASGNFLATLTSGDRAITGAVSGRLFGPQAVEIGAALSGSVSDAANAPGFSFAGAVYGQR